MAYITQPDIETVYGVNNIAVWSNLENDGSGASTSRIAAAIAYAEEYVDNRFRGSRYAIPFQGTSGVPKVLVDWCAKIAGAWLYRSRPPHAKQTDLVANVVDGIENEIDAYLAGQRRLPAADAYPSPSTMVAVTPAIAERWGWGC